jgi:hypothetical protein
LFATNRCNKAASDASAGSDGFAVVVAVVDELPVRLTRGRVDSAKVVTERPFVPAVMSARRTVWLVACAAAAEASDLLRPLGAAGLAGDWL